MRAYEDAVAFADRIDAGEGEVITAADLPAFDPVEVASAPEISRPPVLPGLPIDDYSHGDLAAVAAWVLAQHPLATDQELLPLLMNELGFSRRGTKVVPRLERAIRQARQALT